MNPCCAHLNTLVCLALATPVAANARSVSRGAQEACVAHQKPDEQNAECGAPTRNLLLVGKSLARPVDC